MNEFQYEAFWVFRAVQNRCINIIITNSMCGSCCHHKGISIHLAAQYNFKWLGWVPLCVSVFDPLTSVIGSSSHLWGYSGLVQGNQRRTERGLKRGDKSGSSCYGHGAGNVTPALQVKLEKKYTEGFLDWVWRQWVCLVPCTCSEESFLWVVWGPVELEWTTLNAQWEGLDKLCQT